MTYLSQSPEDTRRFAKKQALRLVQEEAGKPIIIALEGELGAGKTVFAQAFAEALGVHERVKSPTFVLMKHYMIKPTTDNQQLTTLYHLDCYRLRDYKDLEPLGVENILKNPENIVLIEWAERVAEIIPRNHWVVHMDHIAEQTRNIRLELRI